MTAYVYQPYPKMLHKPGGAHCIVHTDAECDAKLADGWALQPVTDAPSIEALLPPGLQAGIDAAQAIASDAPVEPPKRKPGRPRKVAE